MHGATHCITGMTVALAVAPLTGARDPRDLAAAVIIGGFAGLAPDWLQINIPGASKHIKGAFGHRGFSHWLWTPLAMSWLIVSISALNALEWPVAVFFAAWLSHITLDVFADGAPVLWPFGRLTLGHVKTGGQIDKFFGGAFLVLFGVLAWLNLLPFWLR